MAIRSAAFVAFTATGYITAATAQDLGGRYQVVGTMQSGSSDPDSRDCDDI